ncbi:asparagine amidase a [Niveomyces insectorum RCEF 264]|uniref:Asparagine amidase a n=1 Tax=Niveomyces insectorum RCEF 264 TaxID=1081102 RepID=A0A168A2T6_9HYPO|nr:asparagine amidase a [Niveomyces insectorum RCEF 264]
MNTVEDGEAAAPLLERRRPEMPELEKTPPEQKQNDAGRPAGRDCSSSARRTLSLLLPVLFVLGLFLVVAARGRAACWAASRTTTTTTTTKTSASISTSAVPPRVSPSKRDDAPAAVNTSKPAPTVLECFQVAQPVLTPQGPTTTTNNSHGRTAEASTPDTAPCTVILMDHIFANSYGAPFVGEYAPPSCSFNRVVMNFTVVSEGRQFDRLALMYLNDTEVWRTSTAEPVVPPGIRWVYLKDMTPYLALWRAPQKIIFDLGNLINDKYTGSFNATLTATFFTADVDGDSDSDGNGGAPFPPSDLIIPISARQSAVNGVSQFTLPKDNATNTLTAFPRNARRAVFSVSANGQADEEFWWSNVLQSDVLAFNATAGPFTGLSPFREVQVYLDGQLVGVQWPFPVIFTGGVVPGLHRPIVGADVFDLREHEIDVTPWLPLLCDGRPHTFSIQVAGLDDVGGSSMSMSSSNSASTATLTKTVAASWYVTGKIFVWLDDDPDAITTGTPPAVSSSSSPSLSIGVTHSVLTNATGANETLQYTVSVARSLTVEGVVHSQAGSRTVTWSQTLSYANQGLVTSFGFDQINNFTIHGQDRAVAAATTGGGGGGGGAPYTYTAAYDFPLFCNTTTNITAQGNMTLWAALDQGLTLQVAGAAVFPTGLEAFTAAVAAGSAAGTAKGNKDAPSSASKTEGGRRFTGGSLLRTRMRGTASFTQTGDGKNSSGFGSSHQVLHFGGLSGAGMLGQTPDIPLYTRNVSAVNQTIVFDEEMLAAGGGGGGGTNAGSSSSTTTTTTVTTAVARPPPGDDVYAQAPLHGGGTGPRLFMGRGGADPAVAVGADAGTPSVAGNVQGAVPNEQMPMGGVLPGSSFLQLRRAYGQAE